METTIAVGADKLWAEDSGPPSSGSAPGPVVILLHPGIGDSRVWDDMWPRLTRSCRVIRYDVRGYGRSPAATSEYTLLGDLQQVLDHFQVTSVHLVGCSMGGGCAIELALAEPDRVKSLTLLCPGIDGYPWPEEPELEAEAQALEEAGDEDAMIAFYQGIWAAAGGGPRVAEQLRSAIRAEPSEQQYRRPGEPTFDRLNEVRTPTVLLVGELDRAVLMACNEEAAGRIPGCQLIRVPGVDHLVPLRAGDLVNRVVLDQVRGSEPPRPPRPHG
jgi:3-oxoadipate enol-lactonase